MLLASQGFAAEKLIVKALSLSYYNLDYNQTTVYNVDVLFDFMAIVKGVNHDKIHF